MLNSLLKIHELYTDHRGQKEGRQQDLTKIIDLIFNLQKNRKFKKIRRVFAIDEIPVDGKERGATE